ncbi:MAG: class I SAM-dependent methyltransferase [Candidatus Omnitrophica bacterium]|nr:class I SAM-dependent methyltransferase [Candidatus Omnitrophota bacterium]
MLTTLISNKRLLRIVLSDSDFFASNFYFESWIQQRFFISRAIHKDGTILDIGCANGLLLACLMRWCNYEIVPFGIDNNEKRIKAAKLFLKLYTNNFICLKWQMLDRLTDYGLPKTFDFVYWSFGSEHKFNSAKEIQQLKMIYNKVARKGRLIVGFYTSTKGEIARKIARFDKLEIDKCVRLDNPLSSQSLIWIEKG